MGVEFLQANLTAGEISPELHARADIEKYNNGLKEATNMVIMPQGGLRRRPGFQKIAKLDGLAGKNVRTYNFVFNVDQTYLIVLDENDVQVFYEDALVATLSSVVPYSDSEMPKIDIIQSADTMLIFHENHAPQQLQRQGSHTSWAWSTVSFDFIPKETDIIYEFENIGITTTTTVRQNERVLNIDDNDVNGLNEHIYEAKTVRENIDLGTTDFSDTTYWVDLGAREDAWSSSKGYPRTGTFFGNRLWVAGSTSRPTTIWASKINGFFDFDLSTGADDHAISDILDSDEYNEIEKIFSGRTLQVFTSGGEFTNTASPITPLTSSWKQHTGYGTNGLRPILIDGATMFIDSSGRTLRQFLYDYNEDGFVSINASLLSSHLITSAVAMSAIKGTQYDVGDYLYVVNEDGTLAVLNSMRHEKITGWTHWETQGEIKDVRVVGKETYILVEREGVMFIEKMVEGTYMDHHIVETGTDITAVTTNFDAVLASTTFRVLADLSVMDDITGADDVSLPRVAQRIEVGLNFNTKIVTLPLATTTNAGSTLHKRKRVARVMINVLDSLGIYARDRFAGDRQFTVVLNQQPEPFTGFKEMFLLGYDRIHEIEISQKDPLPFKLRALGYEVIY